MVFERQGKDSGAVNGLAHVCLRPLVDNQDWVHATTCLTRVSTEMLHRSKNSGFGTNVVAANPPHHAICAAVLPAASFAADRHKTMLMRSDKGKEIRLVPQGMSFEDAHRIAGELFGSLFARASDKEGFDYALKALLSGEKSPRTLVGEFVKSEEFRERFLMNQTPNEFARRILARFYGLKRVDLQRVKELAVKVLEEDWRDFMSEVVDSPEYYSVHGDFTVPLWV